MNNLRLWIVVLALTSFGAGVGAGVLVTVRMHPRPMATGAAGSFQDYHQRFVSDFGLSSERARLLGDLLASYERAIDDLEKAHLARSMSGLEEDLEALGREYHDLIRDHVLPPVQRPTFDRLATWTPVP